jgi:hypothetical protein
MQNSTVYHATLSSPNHSHVGGSILGCHLATALRAPCSRGVQHSISSSPLYGPTVSAGYRTPQGEVVLPPFPYPIEVCTRHHQRLPYPSAHPASAASQPLGVFATRPRLKRTNLGCSRNKACGRSQMPRRPKPNRTLAARTPASDPFALIPPAYRYQ